jgi:hypothetical protein
MTVAVSYRIIDNGYHHIQGGHPAAICPLCNKVMAYTSTVTVEIDGERKEAHAKCAEPHHH